MTYYVLVNGLIAMFFMIVWKSSNFINVVIKMIFIVLFIWSVYLMFGPAQLIKGF